MFLRWLLTHWGRMMHICVSKLTIIGSDNGLSPLRRQAIIWTYAKILLIGPLGTNFSEILIKILTFSFNKMHSKMSSILSRPQCVFLRAISLMTSFQNNIHDLVEDCVAEAMEIQKPFLSHQYVNGWCQQMILVSVYYPNFIGIIPLEWSA